MWRWRPFKDEPLKFTIGGKAFRFDVFNDAGLISSAFVIFAEVVALMIASAGGDWKCSSSRLGCSGVADCGSGEQCTFQWTPEWPVDRSPNTHRTLNTLPFHSYRIDAHCR